MPKIIKDGVAYGDGVMVDTALDATSENPVQNKVVTSHLTDGIGGTTDTFRFGTDGNGNYGYIKEVSGADTFFPFETGNGYFFSKTRSVSLAAGATVTITFDFSNELSSITELCSYGIRYNSSDPYHFSQVTACSYSGTTVTMTLVCPSTVAETRVAMVTVKGIPA